METGDATVVIRDQKRTIEDGLVGDPDLRVSADATTWIEFVRKERRIARAILLRKVRLKGPTALLIAFGKCFP